MTISLKNLQETAESASPRWFALHKAIPDSEFISAMSPTTALALIRCVRAAKELMHQIQIRHDFSECHSVDHHGMMGRCNCHEKKEVEARESMKKALKEIEP